jgi:hypothetical protein
MPSSRPRPDRSASSQQRGHSVPRPTVDELLASKSRFNKATTDFLKIDLETALTFTALALQAQDREKKERNRKAARKAYDTITRLISRVTFSEVEANAFKENLERLRSDLIKLGESL